MATSALSSAFDYLERLAVNQRRRLYQQPSTALAIFRRMLPHLAKTLVMALLYMRDPVPEADLEAWIQPDCWREKEQVLDLLRRMDMLSVEQDKQHRRSYLLARPFVVSLRQAITGGGDHRSFGIQFKGEDKEKKGIGWLDDFARLQWDSILYFVVGSVESSAEAISSIADGPKKILQSGNFVQTRGSHANITQEGFEFLLRDINAQVWSLLIVYLNMMQNFGIDSIEVLSFLFQLGSLDVGQDYSTAELTESQLKTLDDLHDLGIVYRHPPNSPRFYPTRLATTLTTDANSGSGSLGGALSVGGASSGDQTGFVIVETNYRIYAYTNNPLRIAILSLFVKFSAQFPNMVIGKLTRSSIQSAIRQGITAHQIISYLTTHAHPVMANQSRSNQQNASGKPALPPTVVDQIRLWQIEGDRMTQTTGFLFQAFSSEGQYRSCLEYADTIGVLVWKDDRKQMFFATRFEQIKSFLERFATNGKA